MKKYFLLAAAAATVLAVSCNKEKEQPKVDPTPGTEIEDNTPQPIRFGSNIAEVKAPITKAAIENTGWGAGQTLYVYGFRLDDDGAPSITTADAYIENIPAEAPATFANNGEREPIYVWENSANQIPFYYENAVSYSFFGYYVGTAVDTPEPTIDNDNKAVTLAVTIDGTQDIMLADTDKFDDYLYAKDKAQNATPPSDVTVSIEKVYSEDSARQGVVPDLKFKHQLARFKFETMYGGNGNSDEINIVKLQMMSLKAGTLTIADADEEKIGYKATETTWPVPTDVAANAYGFTDGNSFTLMDANGVAATGNPGNGVFAPFGESIMTFPQGLGGTNNDESPVYHLLLTLTQAGRMDPQNPTQLKQFTVPMDIDFSKVVDAQQQLIPNKYAEAGKMYVIRLVIYGSEEIKMTVSLEDWEYGGETQVDPDQDTRPVPTITITEPSSATLALNLSNTTTGTITATAKYTPIGGTSPADDLNITAINYGTSNKKVATVSVENNVATVKAVGAGNCKIYVYVNGAGAYQGALATVDVTVTGGIAVPDPAPTVTASIVDTQTTPEALSNWTFSQVAEGTAVGTISGSATVGGNPVAAGTWTYEVEDNPYFTVDNNGAIKTKNLTSASAPTTDDLVVTFTAHLAASAGNYSAGQAIATITVPHN